MRYQRTEERHRFLECEGHSLYLGPAVLEGFRDALSINCRPEVLQPFSN